MHEAGHVGARHDLGPGARVVGDPVLPHEAGDRLLRDREGAAEPAALVGARERHELDALERAEEPRHLRRARQEQLARRAEAELAQAVAALVEADPVRVAAGERRDAEDVHEELAQLEGDALQAIEPGTAGEEPVVVVPDHRGAAARGADHRVEPAEDLEEAPGERRGRVREAGVRHRLPAAGLLLGEDHLRPEPLEDARRREPDPRPQLIHVAGDEERDAHRRSMPCPRGEMKACPSGARRRARSRQGLGGEAPGRSSTPPARSSSRAARRSSTVKSDPPPGALCTRTTPPSDSTICRTIQSPRPKPP